MAIYLGRWDCPTCGLKGNAGPDTHCAGCGSPRGKNVRFYLPANAEEVTDADRLKKAKAGADWHCNYCGADNTAEATHCHSCGNERDTQDVTRQQTVDYEGQTKLDTGQLKPVPPPARAKPNPVPKIAAWLFFLGALAGLWYLLRPVDFELTVAGHEWLRTVEVQQNRPFIEEGWDLPAQARLISQKRAVHHYDQVLDGYVTKTRNVRVQTGTRRRKCGKRDLGNGYFEDVYCDEPVYKNKRETYQDPVYRPVPVYATQYRFEVYRWVTDRTLKAQGTDRNPQFPSEALPGDRWREGPRTETYTLRLTDGKGKVYPQKVNLAFWQRAAPGNKLKGLRNQAGSFYGLDEAGWKP
jgi:Zn-finger in Ran binding protein and others